MTCQYQNRVGSASNRATNARQPSARRASSDSLRSPQGMIGTLESVQRCLISILQNAQLTACVLLAITLIVPLAAPLCRAAEDAKQLGFRSPKQLQQLGFKPLFAGTSLKKWDIKPWHEGHWVARDGMIDYDGKGEARRFGDNTLWTKETFTDCILYVEWRLPAKPELKPQPIVLYNGDFLMEEDNPRKRVTRMRLDAGDSGILLRGILDCQANIWSQELGSGEINGYRTNRSMPPEVRRACIPIRKADRPLGEWNVFEITLSNDAMTVVLNGQKVIDSAMLPNLPESGPIGLQHHGDPVQFRNIWVKRIGKEAEFVDWQFGMFLHFNMATFVGVDWAKGHEDPAIFRPTQLDCGQWADVAKATGMHYGVLTVKHTGGWCLWDSAYTDHDITAFKNYKNGKGDIVREYVDAFRSRGLKVGLYYCFPGNYSGKAEDLAAAGKEDLHGLPPEAAGDYVGFMKKQLTELLTRYGPIDMLWIDQYSNKYTVAAWPEIYLHIKSLQPDCVVLANNARSLFGSDVLSYEFPWRPVLPAKTNKLPAEVSDTLLTKSRWFWRPGLGVDDLQSAATVLQRLELCKKRHATYLLNVPPDNTGRIPDLFINRLRQISKQLRAVE